jgi:hypothetical protein
MADDTGIPPFFAIAEVAAYEGVSKDTVTLKARNGLYGQTLVVGNMILISRQGLADAICRSLANPKDERRVAIERFDRQQAQEAAEQRKAAEKQDKDRKRRFSPEGRKADAEARRAQEAAAAKDDPNFGTRRSRLSLITPHLPKTNFRPRPEPVADIATTEEAVLAADPTPEGTVPGARTGYVVTDEQLAATGFAPRERR